MNILLIFLITLAATFHVNYGRVLEGCKCNQDIISEECDCSEMCSKDEFFDRCPHKKCHEVTCMFASEHRSLMPKTDQTQNVLKCWLEDQDIKNTRKCAEGFETGPECICKKGLRREFGGGLECIPDEECAKRGEPFKCNAVENQHYEECPHTIDAHCSDVKPESVDCPEDQPTANLFPVDALNGTELEGNGTSLRSVDPFVIDPPAPTVYPCNKYCLKEACLCNLGYVRDENNKCVLPSACFKKQ